MGLFVWWFAATPTRIRLHWRLGWHVVVGTREVGHEPIFCFWSAEKLASTQVGELHELLAPVVEALGYVLWGVELIARGRHSLLRIYIDSEAGITVDDCALVSQHASGALDVADPIPGAYTLEVSSPGWDRPLFTPAQFRTYVGETVQLRLLQTMQGRRNCVGRLLAADDDGVEIEVSEEVRLTVPYAAIRKANLVIGDK